MCVGFLILIYIGRASNTFIPAAAREGAGAFFLLLALWWDTVSKPKITRKPINDDLLIKTERLLESYFNNGKALSQGAPTVKVLADHLAT